MPETNVYKTLIQVQLPNAAATLTGGTVPSGKSWIIREVRIVNSDASNAYTYALYRNGTTAPFLMTPPSGSIGAGKMRIDDTVFSMGAGETIAGVAGTASKVNVIISGDEVTL